NPLQTVRVLLDGDGWWLHGGNRNLPLNLLIDADRSREKIPTAGNCANDLLRIVAQCPANLYHALGQGVLRNGDIVPDRLDKFVFADQTSRAVKKIGQNFEGFRPQIDNDPIAPKQAGVEIQPEGAEAVFRFAIFQLQFRQTHRRMSSMAES